jgi:hypothetical protein
MVALVIAEGSDAYLVAAMSRSRSNIAEVNRQPALLPSSNAAAKPRARRSVAWITLYARSPAAYLRACW